MLLVVFRNTFCSIIISSLSERSAIPLAVTVAAQDYANSIGLRPVTQCEPTPNQRKRKRDEDECRCGISKGKVEKKLPLSAGKKR
jgi:hypothetical protein